VDPAEVVADDEVAVVVEADSEELITERVVVVVVVDSVADPAVDTVEEDMAVATAAAVEVRFIRLSRFKCFILTRSCT